MNKGYVFTLFAALALTLYRPAPAGAVDFHVSTAQGLQDALTTAAANGANNTIYVTNGLYEGNFNYNSSGRNNLTLTAEPGPTNTAVTIDGAGVATGLTISSSAPSNTIVLSRLRFAIDTNQAAVHIAAGPGAAIVVVGCDFSGAQGDGLDVDSGSRITATSCTVEGAVNGLYLHSADVISIANCTFRSNSFLAVHVEDGVFPAGSFVPAGSVVAASNLFIGNSGAFYSGGASTVLVASNAFSYTSPRPAVEINNTSSVSVNGNMFVTNVLYGPAADSGGAAVTLFANAAVGLADNTFLGNAADHPGGAVFVQDLAGVLSTTNVTLTNNVFVGNTSGPNSGDTYSGGGPLTFNGGAVFVSLAAGVATVSGNTFQENRAAQNGGALCVSAPRITIADNLVAGNAQTDAGFQGGGLWIDASSNLYCINNTITGNTAEGGGGGAAFQVDGIVAVLDVFNNIIWGNAGGAGADVWLAGTGKERLFSHNDTDRVFGVWDVFDANLDRDPQFVQAAAGDYHLQAGSPCLGAGTPSAPALPASDLDGNPRIDTGAVDMGCYERRRPTEGITLAAPAFSGGHVQVSFASTGGLTSAFELLQATQLGGPWTPAASAVLRTNATGSYSFFLPPDGPQAFYRVVSP